MTYNALVTHPSAFVFDMKSGQFVSFKTLLSIIHMYRCIVFAKWVSCILMLHFMYVSCSDFRSGFNGLFDISYTWNGLGGALVTVLLTIIFSLIFGNFIVS